MMRETRWSAGCREEPGVACFLQTIGKFRPLTTAEQSALLRRIQSGARESLDRLVNANLRRVAGIAGEFLGQGLGYMDLIAEGTLGLISAARHFDERHFHSFTRYAEDQIRQRILTALGELTSQAGPHGAAGGACVEP